MDIHQFIARWTASGASERANKDSFLSELCDVVGVPRPDPKYGDRARDVYCYEADAVMTRAAGAPTIGKMDLYKAGAFVLEAKQASDAGSSVLGTARRGTPGWTIAMNDAKGQALAYALTLDVPTPFLIVVDIGHCIDLYAAFGGSTDYQPFPDARARRIYLPNLADHLPLLRTIWTDPHTLDPALKKAEVTREIAGHVAELAASLQRAGHAPEAVARFLMRCLFTMFAEDVDLLPHDVFTNALHDRWIKAPDTFADEVSGLWQMMNTGGTMFGLGRILRFNGGLFSDSTALTLTTDQLKVLYAAARCDWTDVEPAIFGTLLERALDEKERHRLGAHYTPRAYVERLVRPTLEQPLRAEWDLARVEARQLVTAGKVPEAREVVGAFHNTLCTLRVLDPACGTGNFLYVALDVFKRLESEVLAMLADLGDTQAFGKRVVPSQFLGIEKKPWAKEIAELVLWMGYLSWNVRMSGKCAKPKEPVLENYGHIEGRDAVLAWDGEQPVLDAAGEKVTRWDGVTMKIHPVTGNEVPNETARVAVVWYLNPRATAWPEADFVVGNPPFLGNKRMREALGDGYTEALRAAYPDVASTADLVMYWWHVAAGLTRAGKLQRFGLITTNSITQVFNRKVLEAHLGEGKLSVIWAIADHPWVQDGAAVRIAMTVADAASEAHTPSLGTVVSEVTRGAGPPEVDVLARDVGRIHADLRGGANVAGAVRLRANMGLSFQGMNLVGEGFRLTPAEVIAMGYALDALPPVIRPYMNARDLTQGGAPRYVIDFYGLTAEQAQAGYPEAYQWVLDRVKPERDHNNRAAYRDRWWIFAEARSGLRSSWRGLERLMITPITSKHRFFVMADAGLIPDCQLHAVCSGDHWAFGLLSARPQTLWSLQAGPGWASATTLGGGTAPASTPSPSPSQPPPNAPESPNWASASTPTANPNKPSTPISP